MLVQGPDHLIFIKPSQVGNFIIPIVQTREQAQVNELPAQVTGRAERNPGSLESIFSFRSAIPGSKFISGCTQRKTFYKESL